MKYKDLSIRAKKKLAFKLLNDNKIQEILKPLKFMFNNNKFVKAYDEQKIDLDTTLISKTILYIFIHPYLTQEKLDFYKKHIGFNTKNVIKKVVFITSSYHDPNNNYKRYIPTDEIKLIPITNKITINSQKYKEKFNRFNTKEENKNVQSYDDFFKNVTYTKYIMNDNKRINNIKCEIVMFDSNILFRTNGIGCKRFLSQICHLEEKDNCNYCSVDDSSILKYGDNTGTKNNFYDTKYITYISAIYLIYNRNTKDNNYDFFGFRKCSTAGPSDNIITKTKSLYKFLLVKYDTINNIIYDPFCSDFKEDVDWLYRANHNYNGLKLNKVIVFKENPYIQKFKKNDDFDKNTKDPDFFTSENFYNYAYWYKFLLKQSQYQYPNIRLMYDGIKTVNKLKIYINPTIYYLNIPNLQKYNDFFALPEENPSPRIVSSRRTPITFSHDIIDFNGIRIPFKQIEKIQHSTFPFFPCYNSHYHKKTEFLLNALSEVYGKCIKISNLQKYQPKSGRRDTLYYIEIKNENNSIDKNFNIEFSDQLRNEIKRNYDEKSQKLTIKNTTFPQKLVIDINLLELKREINKKKDEKEKIKNKNERERYNNVLKYEKELKKEVDKKKNEKEKTMKKKSKSNDVNIKVNTEKQSQNKFSEFDEINYDMKKIHMSYPTNKNVLDDDYFNAILNLQ